MVGTGSFQRAELLDHSRVYLLSPAPHPPATPGSMSLVASALLPGGGGFLS
jgi:hypothetical protein